jgi:hypothetical protein
MVSVRQEMPTALRWERPILHGAAFARQRRKIATYQNTSLYGRSLRPAYDPRCLRQARRTSALPRRLWRNSPWALVHNKVPKRTGSWATASSRTR